ncbi:MAG: NADH dehydrogenase (quinone) subunit G, partial [Zetaproteobacteria bacterium CG_4_9_14_3_um_filter_53_7]
DCVLVKPRRNRDVSYTPAARSDSFELDVVSRYSMYREGMWARASELLSEAARIHALDDVLVHPQTLAAKGLSVGEHKVRTFLGEATYHIGIREDVSPGVLFVAKRGVAGDLSDVSGATIVGGAV